MLPTRNNCFSHAHIVRVIIKYNYDIALCNWIKGASFDKTLKGILFRPVSVHLRMFHPHTDLSMCMLTILKFYSAHFIHLSNYINIDDITFHQVQYTTELLSGWSLTVHHFVRSFCTSKEHFGLPSTLSIAGCSNNRRIILIT